MTTPMWVWKMRTLWGRTTQNLVCPRPTPSATSSGPIAVKPVTRPTLVLVDWTGTTNWTPPTATRTHPATHPAVHRTPSEMTLSHRRQKMKELETSRKNTDPVPRQHPEYENLLRAGWGAVPSDIQTLNICFLPVCRWIQVQQHLSDSEASITAVGHGEEVVGGAEDEAGDEDLG